jgi:hypothetical protein
MNISISHIEADIRRYQSACGCELGFAFMVGAMILFLVYFNFAAVSWSTGGSVLRGFAWVVAMSTAGKLIGLGYAQVRLRMLRAVLIKAK